jgi:hypothetical protein
LSEIQTKPCLAWFIARDTVPHTTAHRYRLTDYLETIPEAQTEEVRSLSFIIAELHQLTEKLKGMFAAIA